MVGESGDGEQHQKADDPPRPLERVRQTQNAGTDDGDENVGEGLRLRRQKLELGKEWRFFW